MTAGGTAYHAGGVAGEGWHGASDWGGTWHGDGWHAGGYYAGGFHGPTVVNSYYGGGCWGCGAAAVGVAAAGDCRRDWKPRRHRSGRDAPINTSMARIITSAAGTWYQPYYGANGLYYRVVPPL